jgi:hypothetical protein
MMATGEHIRTHEDRNIGFHLTLSEKDRELLDILAHRMGVSRTETISRALHLLESAHEHGMHQSPDVAHQHGETAPE